MDVVIFLIALSILVMVHELGHFLAAKKTGVRVEEFGLGLPPRMWGKKIGDTVWSLNWLPIGGFCKLYGEDTQETKQKEKQYSFAHKNPAQKALIVVGGVLMNLVLAVVIFSAVYAITGVPKETEVVKVIAIVDKSPAKEAGLKEGDVVKFVGTKLIKTSSELTAEVGKYKGGEVELGVISKGTNDVKTVRVEVRANPPEGQGAMGVAVSNIEMVKLPWWRFYEGIGAGFKEGYYWGKVIAGGVFKMVAGLAMGKVPSDVAGPIGMFQATTSIRQNQGILAVIHFFGIVSVNLAVVNILPFPALDGGRILFVIYEAITRKRPSEKFENAVNGAGMAVLLGLILLITLVDVKRLIIGS
ncbi:MAG: M50 family metallopeptidase [Candidatus Shapirobacteria bacterium]